MKLDALEFIRRFLQHTLPAGFMKVRHFGFMNASCAIHPETIRQMICVQLGTLGQPALTHIDPSTTFYCSGCGGPLLIVTRVFPFQATFFDTG